MNNKESKICLRCVMDTSDPSITFNRNGHCNYCTDVLRRMPTEYFPNEEGKKKLDFMMDKMKHDGKGLPYDCMVGLSGGLDSSYVLYLGYRYGLRMLGVHIDDGLDTEKAKSNLSKLCHAAKIEMISVKPEMSQYKDITRCLFLACVPNLAFAQDNIFLASLRKISRQYGILYSLSGGNFSTESILQRGKNPINRSDKTHLIALHREFGQTSVVDLDFITMYQNYIERRYFCKTKTVYPLNYIDYRKNTALQDLIDFCDFEYYGGKHYESILTRFLQCYYLPQKYNMDKRKSHFSSLIVSGQMTRDEALTKLKESPYISSDLLLKDKEILAEFIGMTLAEFESLLREPAKEHTDYPISKLNRLAPIARRFRKYIG